METKNLDEFVEAFWKQTAKHNQMLSDPECKEPWVLELRKRARKRPPETIIKLSDVDW